MWNKESEIFVSITVDPESIIGKIAKASSLEEELREVLSDLRRMVSAKESQPK